MIWVSIPRHRCTTSLIGGLRRRESKKKNSLPMAWAKQLPCRNALLSININGLFDLHSIQFVNLRPNQEGGQRSSVGRFAYSFTNPGLVNFWRCYHIAIPIESVWLSCIWLPYTAVFQILDKLGKIPLSPFLKDLDGP